MFTVEVKVRGVNEVLVIEMGDNYTGEEQVEHQVLADCYVNDEEVTFQNVMDLSWDSDFSLETEELVYHLRKRLVELAANEEEKHIISKRPLTDVDSPVKDSKEDMTLEDAVSYLGDILVMQK